MINKFYILCIAVLLLVGCGDNRNFDGAPSDGSAFDVNEDYIPTNFFSFIQNSNGFSSAVFFERTDGQSSQGTTLRISFNLDSQLISAGNELAGKIVCSTSIESGIKTCGTVWYDNSQSDLVKVLKTYNLYFAVSKIIGFKNSSLQASEFYRTCDSDYGNEILGERTLITLQHAETKDAILLTHIDFGDEYTHQLPTKDTALDHRRFVSSNFISDFTDSPFIVSSSTVNPDSETEYNQIRAQSLNSSKVSGVCFHD